MSDLNAASTSPPGTFRLVGPGRAGGSLQRALVSVGWTCLGELGPEASPRDLASASRGVDLVVVATPDHQVAPVAAQIDPSREALVIHLAGSLGLDALGAHPRRGALHPLASLPSPELGLARLTSGIWFAIAADHRDDLDRLDQLVVALGGHPFEVRESQRAAYHAAACIAANHLVALLGQVQRVADPLGVPLEAFLPLVSGAVASVAELGPSAALTGPVARGDWSTIAGHLDAIAPDERPAYRAMATQARRLVADGADAPMPAGLLDEPAAATVEAP